MDRLVLKLSSVIFKTEKDLINFLLSLVVVELKATKFKLEHIGQLGFYLAAVDDLMRKECDNQSIGILLCE